MVKNILSLLLGGITSNLLNFFAVAYIARILGPKDFGKISFVLAIQSFFLVISQLGVDTIGIKEIARDNSILKSYISNIVFIKLILFIISIILMGSIALFINKPADVKYLILLYGLTLFPLVFQTDWVFKGLEKMQYSVVIPVVKNLLFLGAVWLFITKTRQILWIPLIQFSANLLPALLLLIIFFNLYGRFHFKLDWDLVWEIFAQALPIGIYTLLVVVVNNADSVMLGFMRSEAEVGYYNAAYKLIWLLLGVIPVFFIAIFPLISKYYRTSLEKLQRLLNYAAKIMVTLTIPMAIGGAVLARPILNLVYGNQYANGVIVFQLLIWVVIVLSINTVYAWGLLGCDRQANCMKIVAIQAILNVSLNFMVIPVWGTVGAAIATLMAESSGMFLYFREFKQIVAVPFYRYLLKPLAASLPMLCFLWLGFDLNLFILIAGAVFIYFSSIYIIKGVGVEEINLLKQLLPSNSGTKLSYENS